MKLNTYVSFVQKVQHNQYAYYSVALNPKRHEVFDNQKVVSSVHKHYYTL